jgi:hypothetical protein
LTSKRQYDAVMGGLARTHRAAAAVAPAVALACRRVLGRAPVEQAATIICRRLGLPPPEAS